METNAISEQRDIETSVRRDDATTEPRDVGTSGGRDVEVETSRGSARAPTLLDEMRADGGRFDPQRDRPALVAQLRDMDRERDRLAAFARFGAAPSRDLEPLLAALVPFTAERARGKVSPELRLVDRVTLGRSLRDLEEVAQRGYGDYVRWQLEPESIDDGGLEEAIAEHLPSTHLSIVETFSTYRERPFVPAVELVVATILRALYSPRQLFERMVLFWSDHFNVDVTSDFQSFLKPTDDREVIRAHALGRFPDLLAASAKSPAMLVYLDNVSNVREHPNENYARELMELHTLGADNGYTEQDVKEVARCFTGWTVGDRGTFAFAKRAHDYGEKVVLGETIPAGGGVEDGERVLAILAAHENTARFLADKVLRWLWGYEPPEEAVDAVAQVYLDRGGAIAPMVREVLRQRWMSTSTPKVKRPFHQLMSSIRGLFAQVTGFERLWYELQAAGHLPFTWHPPNGFPDDAGYWSGFLLPRWNAAADLLDPEHGIARADLSWLEPGMAPAELVRRIDFVLFGGSSSGATRGELTRFLRRGRRNQERIREAVGLALASPDFLQY